MSDAELMKRAACGAESAFAELVEKYQNALLNFFLRKGVSYADGQDLTQQTFLRLWRYRGRYSPQAKFTTFLFLLAGQVSIDFFRAEGRRHGLEDGYERELEVRFYDRGGETSPSAGAGEDVRRAVARLSPALRDVVELAVFQDLPYSEVSEILSIPEGTVKSRMFNALKKLKEQMNER